MKDHQITSFWLALKVNSYIIGRAEVKIQETRSPEGWTLAFRRLLNDW